MARNRGTNGAMNGTTATQNAHNVAAYLRVSTDEQAQSGLGLGDQRRRCAGMAAAKGWPEPTDYADEGASGTKDAAQRPALARLLEDVRAGRVDAVIVSELSRLGRKTRLVLHLVEEVTQNGAVFVSCAQNLDTTTPTGQFTLTMFAALAQLERDQIAERTRGAMAQLSATKGETGGRLPFGYLRDAGDVVVDPKRAEVVRRVFAWDRRGLSLRQIAARLNQEAVSAPYGAKWHHTTVATILANGEAYRGGLRGASAQHRWPRILGTPRPHEEQTTAA